MIQIYVDEGLILLLRRISANGDDGANKWFLFSNNVTPTRATILADLTIVPNPVPQEVTNADFILENITDHVGSIQAENVVFENTSGDPIDVYGYGIMDASESVLLACARFDDAPRTIADLAETQVTPILADFSELGD